MKYYILSAKVGNKRALVYAGVENKSYEGCEKTELELEGCQFMILNQMNFRGGEDMIERWEEMVRLAEAWAKEEN